MVSPSTTVPLKKTSTKFLKCKKKLSDISPNPNTTAHLLYSNPLFVSLGILPLEHLITETRGILMHSIYHKCSPTSLHNEWITNESRGLNHDHDLRNGHDLYIPFARTDHAKRLSYFSLPKTWNDLPDSKLNSNVTTFRMFLKSHLLSQLNDCPPH